MTVILDDPAVDKVINNVCASLRGGESIPADLDRVRLRLDLEDARNFCEGCQREDGKAHGTEQLEILNKFAGLVCQQRALLPMFDRADAMRLIEPVLRLELEVSTRIGRKQQWPWRPILDGLSPQQWLIARGLAGVFERHFGMKAVRHFDRGVGQVRGPFVAFVCAVTALWGDPVQPGVINLAMTESAKAMQREAAAEAEAAARVNEDVPPVRTRETVRRDLPGAKKVIALCAAEKDPQRKAESRQFARALKAHWRGLCQQFGIDWDERK
jgi:hypothetical protein